MTIIGLLILVLVFAMFFYLIKILPIDAGVKQILYVIVVFILVIWILQSIAYDGMPILRLR
jgi:hypothetical protein